MNTKPHIRAAAQQAYDNVAEILASKQITPDMIGQRVGVKGGPAYEVVAPGTGFFNHPTGAVGLVIVPKNNAVSSSAAPGRLQAFLNGAASRGYRAKIDTQEVATGVIEVPSGSKIEIEAKCGISLADGVNVGALLMAVDGTDISIKGRGYIDANRSGQTSGDVNALFFRRGSDVCVRDVKLRNFAIGARFIGTTDFSVKDSRLKDGTIRGVLVENDTTNPDTPVIAEGFVLSGNRIEDVKTSSIAGTTVDGHGILIRGQEGYDGRLSWVRDFEIRDNICLNNGRSGIAIISGEDFTLAGNRCSGHTLNTDIGAGIILSVGARNFSVYGNRCNGNHDAGILVDTLDETGVSSNTINYGKGSIYGNVCRNNVRGQIKINCAPAMSVYGNVLSGGLWGVFWWYYSERGILRDNQITGCSENGIRLAGSTGEAANQTRLLLSDNKIKNCGAGGSGTSGAIYVANFSEVYMDGHEDIGCTVSLRTGGTVTGMRLSRNRFRGSINIGPSSQIAKWDGDGLDTCTGFSSTAFGGEGKDAIRVNADFVIPHYGLCYVRLTTISNVTGGASGSISPGVRGQELLLHNVSSFSVTIPSHSTVVNTGGGAAVIPAGGTARYVYGGSAWRQV